MRQLLKHNQWHQRGPGFFFYRLKYTALWFFAIGCLGLGLLASIPAVFAQGGASQDLYESSLEELINTPITVSSLFDTDKLSSPSTATHISRAQWQPYNPEHLLETISHRPGVMAVPTLYGAEELAIRGYNSFRINGTALLWDGVTLNDYLSGSALLATPRIHLDTLDAVELIEGAASALYGSSAFHGVLSLQPFNSTVDVLKASAAVGSDDYYQVSTRVSQHIRSHTQANVAIGFSGQGNQKRTHDYSDPFSGLASQIRRKNDYDAGTVSLKFVTRPSSKFVYDWGFYTHSYVANDFSGVGTRSAGHNDLSDTDTQFYMTKFSAEYQFEHKARASVQTYYWLKETQSYFSLRDSQMTGGISEQTRLGLQGQYTINISSATQVGVSTELDQFDIDESVRTILSESGDLLLSEFQPSHGRSRTVGSLAVEGNSRFGNEAWLAVYGARVDRYSDFGSHTSPRLGVIFQPDDFSSYKFFYGHAFRAPTASERFGSSTIVISNENLKPETLETYELIWMQQKSNWFSEWVVFYSHWQDSINLALLSSSGTPTAQYVSSGGLSAKGMTYAWRWEADLWKLYIAGAYVESDNKTTQTRYKLFPLTSLDVGVGYYYPAKRIRFLLSFKAMRHFEDVDPITTGVPGRALPSYYKTNINIVQAINEQCELWLKTENIFDRTLLLPSPIGSIGGVPDDRRAFALGFRYRF